MSLFRICAYVAFYFAGAAFHRKIQRWSDRRVLRRKLEKESSE